MTGNIGFSTMVVFVTIIDFGFQSLSLSSRMSPGGSAATAGRGNRQSATTLKREDMARSPVLRNDDMPECVRCILSAVRSLAGDSNALRRPAHCRCVARLRPCRVEAALRWQDARGLGGRHRENLARRGRRD